MTFESHIRAVLTPNIARTTAPPANTGPDSLAALAYKEEIRIKRAAWGRFAKELKVGDARIEDVIESPMPRAYRATSRRHVIMHRGSAALAHGEGSLLDATQAALLEPESHARIYDVVARLVRPAKPPLMLNNVIIRGSYEELVVIFDVREVDADVVRTLRKWTKTISTSVPELKHAWIYHDPSNTNFFIEQERPPHGHMSKKIVGSAAWIQNVNNIDYQIGVLSFTQINLAMIPTLIDVVRRVRGAGGGTLYDLFSGYGLFGAAFAKEFGRIVAIDADDATIANARYNIKRAGGAVTAVPAMMARKTMDRLLESEAKIASAIEAAPRRTVILDPPRGGVTTGVRALIAELEPQRIVELFNEPDEINHNVREWAASGYACDTVVPLDLYPGRPTIEVVLGFTKKTQPVRSRAQVKTSR